MPKFVNNLDLNKNELRNAVLHVLSSAPASPVVGQVYYDSVNSTLKICTASSPSAVWLDLGKQGTVTSVGATAPIQSTGGTTPTISIDAASGSSSGSMSSAHYTLVNNATNANTASTIVKRDASGDFSAGMITADLTGDVTGQVSDISNHDTDDLAEGTTNLYYTDTRVRANRLDQMTAPTASVSFNSQKITSLADPENPQDAATKAYVDAARSGLDVKASVRAATTAPLTIASDLEDGDILDGVTLATGNRVLVKNQSTASENGIYVVQASGAAVRADDADTNAEVTSGMFTFVEEGTVNADSGWVLTTNNPITLGSTGLVFAQFSGAGQITAGAGLTKTGNTIDVVGTSDRITVNADSVDIAATYVGQNTITTLGTITTGTWDATTVAVTAGGTGNESFTDNGVIYGNGSGALDVTSAGTQYEVLQAGASGVPTFGALNLAQAAAITGTLPIGNGGTGATTQSGVRTNLVSDITTGSGVSTPELAKVCAKTIGDGSATAYTIDHNFNTRDVVVQVIDIASGSDTQYETVYADVKRNTVNQVTVTFAVAPALSSYRVVITG
jgi:hypothetical protein